MGVIKCRLQGGWCLYYTVLSLVSSMLGLALSAGLLETLNLCHLVVGGDWMNLRCEVAG